MTLDSAELVVAGEGGIYAAAAGTPFPDSIEDPIDLSDWLNLGYTTDAGVKFKFARTSKKLTGWPGRGTLRTIITETTESAECVLQQMNQVNLSIVFGGGTHQGAAGDYEYHPPDGGAVSAYSFIYEFTDGDRTYRVCVYEGKNDSGVELPFMADSNTTMALNVSFEVPSAENANEDFPTETWFLQHNDDATGVAPVLPT